MFEDVKENIIIIKEENLRIEMETILKRAKWKFLSEKYNIGN